MSEAKETRKVLVFGDVMLDEYIYGLVKRVSPEAPVPVINVQETETRLGGAGNVANGIVALDAECACVFAVGEDADADTVMHLLDSSAISTCWACRVGEISTMKKSRLVGNRQQIARLDYNDSVCLDARVIATLKRGLSAAVAWADVVVISDYGKGTCTPDLCKYLISLASRKGAPVIVDPKGTDWSKYRGATFITPNMHEVNLFSGREVPNTDDEIEHAYSHLPSELGIENVLITRSEQGMSLVGEDRSVVNLEARRHEVFDVSGAGDSVVAALSVLFDANLGNAISAASMANVAAGISVSKFGTSTVTWQELQRELSGSTSKIENKIYEIQDRERLISAVSSWRSKGETIVATSGCFDIIHRGHVQLLAKAAELGDRLIVALNSDASVKRLKGDSRPINGELDRAFVLASLGYIDAVVVFDTQNDIDSFEPSSSECPKSNILASAEEAPMGLMRLVGPDVYVKGGDYSRELVPEALFAGSYRSIPYVEGYSTTKVVESCK